MTSYLHGHHDPDLAHLMANRPGWIVFTEAIGADPNDHSGGNYSAWADQGFGILVRINNGYHPAGTIPGPEAYAAFAERCANYVSASPACTRVIIGNEPQHQNERPGGQPILPTQYAKCYDLCYQAIKNVAPHCLISPAPVAPWDATTKYEGNDNGDWVQYFWDMLVAIAKADFLTLHTYSHGDSPSLITDETKMAPPFDMYHYNFRAYRDLILAIPDWYGTLPIYITETDQVKEWTDANNGWVQAAYAEIDNWNRSGGQKIHALCLYRSSRDDEWSFADKAGVQQAFEEVVSMGYTVADAGPGPTPPDPTPPTPTPPTDSGDYLVSWDPRLDQRGCTLHVAQPANDGGMVDHVVMGEWFDEQQAQGRVNVFITLLDEQGNLIVGEDVTFKNGGSETKKTERKFDPWLGREYSLDFAMYETAPAYFVYIAGAVPSDEVDGLGLGSLSQPDYTIHVAYSFTFQRLPSSLAPPIPPQPSGELVHPCPGAPITQHFGQSLEDYSELGLWGHDGCDFGVAAGTPIACVASGVVVYSAWDDGYGNYVRVSHDQLGCYSFYSHLLEPGAPVGTVLKAGDTVGKVGSTGNSTAAHLHLEIRLQNVDGSYKAGTPMPNGRCDPETWAILHGLSLGG